MTSDEPAAVLVAAVLELLERRGGAGGGPLFVGIDGRSGSGKSTLAGSLRTELLAVGRAATVIEGDDFYAGGSAATWDGRSAEEKAASVIEWRRQREVLDDLRVGGAAEWRPFDWESDDWDAEPPPLAEPVRAVAGEVVVVDGAYSCRPELADLLDLRVLLVVPAAVRRRQLLEREGAEYRDDWEARWSQAEDHYFDTVAPASSFDLVLGHA